jgi:hypothetical protein
MDFFVCKRACGDIRQRSLSNNVLTNVNDITEAISRARDIALGARKGVTVGLFTADGKPVYGWKVIEEGKLKYQDIEVIQDVFYNVSLEDFKLAKRLDEIRKIPHHTFTN